MTDLGRGAVGGKEAIARERQTIVRSETASVLDPTVSAIQSQHWHQWCLSTDAATGLLLYHCRVAIIVIV